MGVANSCTVRFPNWLPNNLEVPYERKIKASRIRMDNTTRSCADDVVAFDVMVYVQCFCLASWMRIIPEFHNMHRSPCRLTENHSDQNRFRFLNQLKSCF